MNAIRCRTKLILSALCIFAALSNLVAQVPTVILSTIPESSKGCKDGAIVIDTVPSDQTIKVIVEPCDVRTTVTTPATIRPEDSTGFRAGSYTVKIKDSEGNTFEERVTIPLAKFSVTVTQVDAHCHACDGSFTTTFNNPCHADVEVTFSAKDSEGNEIPGTNGVYENLCPGVYKWKVVARSVNCRCHNKIVFEDRGTVTIGEQPGVAVTITPSVQFAKVGDTVQWTVEGFVCPAPTGETKQGLTQDIACPGLTIIYPNGVQDTDPGDLPRVHVFDQFVANNSFGTVTAVAAAAAAAAVGVDCITATATAQLRPIPGQVALLTITNGNSKTLCAGQCGTFTVTVTNISGTTANNVVITDAFPSCVRVTSVSGTGPAGLKVSGSGNAVLAKIPSLAPGQSVTLTITVQSSCSRGQLLQSVATVTSSNAAKKSAAATISTRGCC